MTEKPPYSSEKLADWLNWLEQLDPSRIEFGLDRIRQVHQQLPQLSNQTKVVTIAGTNGKGSTLAALQASAVALKKSVVSFSSPHLLRYNERIQIQGQRIEDAELVSAFQKISQAQNDIFLTYFEYSALAALIVAAGRQPELLILEVGLGGRLDAVNMIDADMVILTAIGMDHMNWLGNDLESIAQEKCGVLRQGIPVILASAQMPKTVYSIAEKKSVQLYCFGKEFDFKQQQDDLQQVSIGKHNLALHKSVLHPQSLAAAAMAIALVWPDSLPEIAPALESVSLNGRFQQNRLGSREIIFDVAHNSMSVANLCQRLKQEGIDKVDLVFALMADKDSLSIIQLLKPFVRGWKLLDLDNPRAVPVKVLSDQLSAMGISDIEIIRQDSSIFQNKDFIDKTEQMPLLVSGSFYTVSAVLEWVSESIRSI